MKATASTSHTRNILFLSRFLPFHLFRQSYSIFLSSKFLSGECRRRRTFDSITASDHLLTMTMLSVCSATPCCSSHCRVSLNGGLRSLYSFRKDYEFRCLVHNTPLGLPNKMSLSDTPLRTQALRFSYGNTENNIQRSVWSSLDEAKIELDKMGHGRLRFVDSPSMSTTEDRLLDFADESVNNVTTLIEPVKTEGITAIGATPDYSITTPEPLFIDSESSSELKSSFENILSGFNDSLNASVEKGESTLRSSLDAVNSSIASLVKSATEAIEGAGNKVSSTVEQMGESTGNGMTNISTDLKGAASKATIVGVDLLRRTVVLLEDSFTKGASFVVYSYSSAKELLPPEIKDTLNLSEEKTAQVLNPVGVAFQQIVFAIEKLERSLGFDPSDPLVPFVLILGSASTLWIFYWVSRYSGYSGDLPPNLTLELLKKDNGVLIDVRPEALREIDGIPDLRRAARYRYSSVSIPEVNGSVRKLLKGGRDLEDSLIATVIRNLRVVQDRSKVIVMDADGSRSKGIARSLRKLGIRQSYMVKGGFRSWENEGLRIKELKPETTLTVLNEEAEAILEEINPSPLQVLGYSVGLVAALYALAEWEKTLQIIGVLGLGQTIYRRVASYQDAEDLWQDFSQLLLPVKLGGEAFAWAAGKLETNGIGLPTSPSSSDVQNRVLQAAARHESQPPEDEATLPDSISSPAASAEGGGDLSEA